MSPYDQARVFLAMMLCGAGLGAAYDLLSLLRQGRMLTVLADLLLGLLCAAGVVGAALLLRCDPFRLYMFAGVMLGFAIYMLSLGTIVRILKKSFIKLSKKVAN